MPTINVTAQGALRKSTLRQANERLVLDTIRQNPAISRSDLVKITGLSPSSVTFIINRLIRNNLIIEQDRRDVQPQVGRRPVSLRLRPEALMAVGVQVSQAGSRLVLADMDGGFVQTRFVSWHPHHELFFGRINDAIRSITENLSPKQLLGVGVGLPGAIDRSNGRIIGAENYGWFDIQAGRFLRQGLTAKFHYENDAKLLALAERWFCEPGLKPLQNFAFVALGEGLGTGVIVDGKLLHGAHGAASEFGHTILYPDGRRCVCGNTGCWEEYASERALRRLYAKFAELKEPERAPDGAAITQLARDGDPAAIRVWRETAMYIGLGFANIVMALTPEAIVVGDMLAQAWDIVQEHVWGVLRARVPHYYLAGMRIFPSRHGSDAHLSGAVALVLANFFTVSGHREPAASLRSVTVPDS